MTSGLGIGVLAGCVLGALAMSCSAAGDEGTTSPGTEGSGGTANFAGAGGTSGTAGGGTATGGTGTGGTGAVAGGAGTVTGGTVGTGTGGLATGGSSTGGSSTGGTTASGGSTDSGGAAASIDSPYRGYANWYKGATHCHTTNSDGANTPSEMATAYQTQRYDFVCITDHDYLTADPGVSGIVFIPSEEVTDDGADDTGAIGLSSFIAAGQSRQATIDAALSQGAFVQINHPIADGVTSTVLDALTGYLGMELLNGKRMDQDPTELWDRQLSMGKRVWATYGDDAHSAEATGLVWIMVNSPSNAPSDIVENMRTGNFYASRGPTMNVSVSGATITVSSTDGGTINWYKENVSLIQTTTAATDSYTATGSEVFVRAEVVADGGAKAISQPMFIVQ